MSKDTYFNNLVKSHLKGDLGITNKGTFKSCVVTSTSALLVVDLNGIKEPQDEFLESRSNYISYINALAKSVNTPAIIRNAVMGNVYLELQERVKGANAWIVQEKEAVKLLDTKEAKGTDVLPEWQRGMVLGKIYNYNVDMQRKIKQAKPQVFIKLLKDIRAIYQNGFSIDLLGQNVFYDAQKGFSFIDLDYTGAPQEVSGYDVVYTAFRIVDNFNKYKTFFKPGDQETIYKNNAAIINQIVRAASGIQVSEHEWKKLQDYAAEICNTSTESEK